MKTFFKDFGWAFYLGGALGYVDITFMMVEYYIVFIPTMLLVVWGKD